jgi:hypothetical protein
MLFSHFSQFCCICVYVGKQVCVSTVRVEILTEVCMKTGLPVGGRYIRLRSVIDVYRCCGRTFCQQS